MEKQIIYNMIYNNDFIEIPNNQLHLFSNEFRQLYNIVRVAHNKGLTLSKEVIEILSSGKNVDLNFAQDNPLLVHGNDVILDMLMKQKRADFELKQLKDRIANYEKTGDLLELKQINQIINNKVKKEKDVNLLQPIEVIKQNQIDFIERIYRKEPQDGLYIAKYGDGGSTQFKQLANYLRIIERTDFIVLAGRPSVGKTAFSLALTNALIKNGYRGAYFSLEMSNEQLLHRMAMAKSGITHEMLFSKDGIKENVLTEYISSIEKLSKMPLFITEKLPRSWKEIEASILALKGKIDFVVVDYLGLISSYDGNDTGQPKYMVVGNISRDMKLFAREHKIAIIALQQLGRDMGSTKERGDLSYQEPFMNNLRDSGGIEQDVDKALFLYRRKPANEKEKFLVENGKTLVVCKIDKNRSGKIGKIDMVFDGEVQRFKEAEINEQSNHKQ